MPFKRDQMAQLFPISDPSSVIYRPINSSSDCTRAHSLLGKFGHHALNCSAGGSLVDLELCGDCMEGSSLKSHLKDHAISVREIRKNLLPPFSQTCHGTRRGITRLECAR